MEDRLRKFACLAEAGSFSAAAEKLHISQPALSVAIAKLERELRAPLVVRGVRPLSLTAAGRFAYATAKDMAVSTDNLVLRLAELAQAEISLTIGMIDSIASTLFASNTALLTLERRANISIVVDNSRSLAQDVEQGALDAALIVQPRKQSALLAIEPLADEPLVLVCHSDVAPQAAAAIANGVLSHFISYDRSSTTFQLVGMALEGEGIQIVPDFYSTSPEVMLRLVRMRRGTAALPYLVVREYVASGELTLVNKQKPLIINRPISICRRRDKQLAIPLVKATRQLRRRLITLSQQANV